MRRAIFGGVLGLMVAGCWRAPADRAEASGDSTESIGGPSSSGAVTATGTGGASSTPIAIAAAIDSLRGVIVVTGNEPLSRVTIEAEGETWLVDSAASPSTPLSELRGAAGLEVTLVGVADSTRRPGGGPVPMRSFRLLRFFVRAVDGQPAVDGILVQEPSGALLRLSDGTSLPIAEVPPALASQIGARIYWAGSTAEAPMAYGVLRAPSR